MPPSSKAGATRADVVAQNRRTFALLSPVWPKSMPPQATAVATTHVVSHEAAMQPFFKLRLACAISTLPTTQAPRRLYYAARAGYVPSSSFWRTVPRRRRCPLWRNA